MKKKEKLSFILYKLLRKKQENEPTYQSEWLNMIESKLAYMGMNDIWMNESMGFNSLYRPIKESVKRRLKDKLI